MVDRVGPDSAALRLPGPREERLMLLVWLTHPVQSWRRWRLHRAAQLLRRHETELRHQQHGSA